MKKEHTPSKSKGKRLDLPAAECSEASSLLRKEILLTEPMKVEEKEI